MIPGMHNVMTIKQHRPFADQHGEAVEVTSSNGTHWLICLCGYKTKKCIDIANARDHLNDHMAESARP